MQNGSKPTPSDIVKECLPELSHFEEIYKDIHRHPELGRSESRTASIVIDHLTSINFTVFKGVGGHGVVGIFRNGGGKKVLLRADMDALPIFEETGLPYASTARGVNADGNEVPLMHACGHDMHVACLLASCTLLTDAKSKWQGTLIALFQPNEEGGAGAGDMIKDGLYDKVPIPDVVLGQHVDFSRTGSVFPCYGTFMAAADSLKVKIFGRGGHGSRPQSCIDPVLIAGHIIVRLQSIVSRSIAPTDAAVVTVASIHGGEAENVIPEEVVLKLNMRAFDPQVRATVLEKVKSIIKSEASSAGAPKEPEFSVISEFPSTTNNDPLMKRIETEFKDHFGSESVGINGLVSASEDVSNLAKPHNIPLAFWYFGGTDQKQWDDSVKNGDPDSIPKNHSSKFAPVIQPTLTTGVQALSLATLHYLMVS